MKLQTSYSSTVFFLPVAASAIQPFSCNTTQVIHRDVTIIGGGASGTYAAIQLHDLGKSVALIDRKPILGGHTNTYVDPTTNQTIDYGVHQWNDLDVVTEFFERLNVPYTKAFVPSPGDIINFDFKRGKLFNQSIVEASVDAYSDVVAKYDYLQYGTELPNPVPQDIYRPFGNIVKKYGLEGFVNNLWTGQGDILTMPALYIFKDVGTPVVESMRTNFIYTANHNNYEIFAKALEVLDQDNVFLSTTVSHMQRDAESVSICVESPTGRKLIRSKKLLNTIPPILDHLHGYDLSEEEKSVFRQFRAVGYYVSLVRIPGLPASSFMYKNIASDTIYGQPRLPALYRITRTEAPELYIVEYGSLTPLTDQAVQDGILRSIDILRQQVGGRLDLETKIVAYDSHTPYHVHVASEAIRDGFYKSLYALQGRRNTFYSGAAFHAHDSALLWRFTKGIVEGLIKELE
ncbi:hypothetical protein BDV27DRAFT_172376 [Aspergillus caelatus]|uniref:Amine oxidase domain-containing protein n=1 Tax=Aspergillus caelatus TaxID=61420 RepID=A0A5N7ALY2_9EURO|nr:uncharacterized protein BDV27DRAFT_172376 [Aspergillus caelatus]KAE8369710.1 hypothetical protein BDV27DRAFT_172376 [Aspergillus caelatus]